MNCRHVQELLPLYVGRDLDEKLVKLVTAHLQSCAECARSADEYREAQQLLQLFEPPPFSEAVYAGIRQRVLREIGRESTTQTLPQSIASLFRPRIRWAIATALLLAVSAFAFYFISNRRNEGQQVRRAVDHATQEEQGDTRSQGRELAAAPSPSSTPNNVERPANINQNTGAIATVAGSGDRTHQSQRGKSSGATADRVRSVAVNRPNTRMMTAGAAPESNNLVEADAFPARDPGASERTLRVEMQTKDPNIRIIWISHQRAKQDSLR